MKTLLIFIFSFVPVLLFSQSAESKRMLAEINGQYTVDDFQNVNYTKVIDLPGLNKNDLFLKALAYFVYNYNDGSSVIQTQDKEAGLIIGKGIFEKVFVAASLITTQYNVWHIMRVDVKEEKVRVILTLTDYKYSLTSNTGTEWYDVPINTCYPINIEGGMKNQRMKAFYAANKRALEAIDNFEISLKEGNTSKTLENKDW